MMRIKKNDNVLVLSGKDKGKHGVVIDVLPKKGKVLVKGVALVTRHLKARKQGDVPSIKKMESFINVASVMPICRSCKKPSRTNVKMLENGKRARICNRCKEIM